MEVAEAGGEDGSVVEILAAMLPCSRLYGFLGCALAGAHGGSGGGAAAAQAGARDAGATPNGSSWGQQAAGAVEGGPAAQGGAQVQEPGHEFWGWVKTYSSAEYLAIPALKEALFDRLAVNADKAKLQALYRRAMQLEAQFFDAQPHSPPPRRVCALVVDFDETCTRRDTIGGLMRLAASAAAAGRPTPGDAAWAEATPAALAAGYVAAQKELLAELLPDGPAAASYDAAGLSSFLERLSDFDERMNVVVEESGILSGSTPEEVAAAGASQALRPHCRETLRGALDRGIPVHVVSVNWSDQYVGAALGLPTALGAAEPGAGAAAGGPAVQLRCNSLQLGPDGLTSGRLVKRVQGARDKRAALQALRDQLAAAGVNGGGGGGGGLLVYVGDSSSDLAALTAADVGVVVGANGLLRRVAARFGLTLRPLAAAPLDPAAAVAAAAAGVLYEAAGWEEVRAFLFGVEWEAAAGGGGPLALGGGCGAAAAAAAGSAALPRVLSIAGSDSGGGAGIQADIKAILCRGVFAMTAVTALTAQNTHGVSGVHAVPPAFLAAQMDAVLSDLGADALKTGMLPNAEAVAVVAERVRHYRALAAPARALPLVVDPVLLSTSGHSLAEGGVAGALLRLLLPLADLATPNLPEAEALLGCGPISSVEGMRRAAVDLQKRTGCGAVLVKGGHLKPPGCGPDGSSADGDSGSGAAAAAPAAAREVVDVLYDGSQLHELRSEWVQTANMHGTGCTLAAAIAAELAKGAPLLAAVASARAALHAALSASAPLRLGGGVQRPFHHLHMLEPQQAPGARRQQPQQQQALAAGASAHPAGALPAGGAGAVPDPEEVRRQLRLYAVTDPDCNAKRGRSLLEAVAAAVRGGATMVQLRNKDCEGGAFAAEAAEALKVCRAAGVPLIVNDRVDVALAVGADGVHVGQGDLPAHLVRALIGPSRILGVSVKTPAQAAAAAAAGADYLGCGAVLPTGTKSTGVIGLGGLAAVCAAAGRGLPVVAIGGLDARSAAEAIRAGGAAGVAVVSAIFGAEDAEGAARALREAVDAALRPAVGP